MIKAAQPPADLTWLHEITSHPHWPKMEALLFQEIPALMNNSLVVSKGGSARGHAALTACGLDAPETHEEQLRVYLALRAVLVYLTKKKELIEAKKKEHATNVQRGIADGTLSREPQATLKGH